MGFYFRKEGKKPYIVLVGRNQSRWGSRRIVCGRDRRQKGSCRNSSSPDYQIKVDKGSRMVYIVEIGGSRRVIQRVIQRFIRSRSPVNEHVMEMEHEEGHTSQNLPNMGMHIKSLSGFFRVENRGRLG